MLPSAGCPRPSPWGAGEGAESGLPASFPLERVLRDGDPSGFKIAVALKEAIIRGHVALDFGICWE